MDDYKNANDGARSNIYLVRGNYVTSRVARSKDIGTSCSVYMSGYPRYVRYVLATRHRLLPVKTYEFPTWKALMPPAICPRLRNFMSTTRLASYVLREDRIFEKTDFWFVAFSLKDQLFKTNYMNAKWILFISTLEPRRGTCFYQLLNHTHTFIPHIRSVNIFSI